MHHHARSVGDFKAWRVLWQKPAGGEMFYKLILLSGSLFSTHGFTWQPGRERASPGPRAVLHPACAVYIYLLDRPQRSGIFLISTGILQLSFQAAKACVTL